MEVSSLSLNSTAYLSSSPAECLLIKTAVTLPLRDQHLSCISLNRTSQPFLRQAGSLIHRKNSTKVLCSLKREIPIIDASSMDEIYDALAERLLPTAAVASNPNFKHIVGLVGPPGAGKSTVASEVVQRVNKLWPQNASSFDSQVKPPDVAAVLPMDGFHLYRSQLDAMENPEEAHARRGAPWTFAPALLFQCLKKLRNEGSVYAPSFDHAVGDPIEDDIFVSLQCQFYTHIQYGKLLKLEIRCLPEIDGEGSPRGYKRHKVVIVEGNYLLLEEGAWKDMSSVFDEKWFIDVDIDRAMQRVLKRHNSIGKPPDVAKWRIDYNDRPNAELIIKSKKNADLVIRSIDF